MGRFILLAELGLSLGNAGYGTYVLYANNRNMVTSTTGIPLPALRRNNTHTKFRLICLKPFHVFDIFGSEHRMHREAS